MELRTNFQRDLDYITKLVGAVQPAINDSDEIAFDFEHTKEHLYKAALDLGYEVDQDGDGLQSEDDLMIYFSGISGLSAIHVYKQLGL